MQPTKRKFIPTFESVFADQKRFKTETSYEGIKPEFSFPATWNARIEMQSYAAVNDGFRENLINSMMYSQKSELMGQSQNGNSLKNDTEIEMRTKVKAKVVKQNKDLANVIGNNQSSKVAAGRSKSLYELPGIHKSHRPPTVPQPFNLTEFPRNRTAMENKSIDFVARQMPDFSAPFCPKPSQKVPTRPFNVEFSTEDRAEKREIYNEKVKQKEREAEMFKKLEREEQEKREKEEIRMIRKHMEFKAMPLPGSQSCYQKSFSSNSSFMNSQGLNTSKTVFRF